MISKIVVKDFLPFKPASSLNLKKFNLIIGKNGVGKTRLFKTLNNGLPGKQNRKNIDSRLQECFEIFDDKELIGTLCTSGALRSSYFTLLTDKQIQFLYVPDRRIPSSSYVSSANYGLTNLESNLFSNFLFKPECVDFTNTIFTKLFNRKIDTRKTSESGGGNSVDRLSYKRGENLIDPFDDGYGILQTMGIFQILYLALDDTTVVIEEPTANLYPSVIKPLINEIISIATSKNLQLIIITHDIITSLIFLKKIWNKDVDTTVHKFDQVDDITYIHNIEKDNITSSLEDFLGEFPEKDDITLLKDVAGFNPEF